MQSNNDYCASVQPGSRAPYEASFKWNPTYQLASSHEEAVEQMLERTNLIPSECNRGIKYLRGGEAEGGWGWAEIECRQ